MQQRVWICLNVSLNMYKMKNVIFLEIPDKNMFVE